MEEIKLRQIGEPEDNSLPRGIVLIMVGTKPIFARRMAGRFLPLSEDEQIQLRKKHIIV